MNSLAGVRSAPLVAFRTSSRRNLRPTQPGMARAAATSAHTQATSYTTLSSPCAIQLVAERSNGLVERTLEACGLGGSKALPGTWPLVPGAAPGAAPRAVYDPTTRKALAMVAPASKHAVDTLLDQARSAQKRWANLSGDQRVAIVLECNQVRSQLEINLPRRD